jgi:hypothetical protein
MARNPPPEHTRWKPGQSGNIAGRPKREMTADSVALMIEKYMLMSQSSLVAIVKDPESKGIEALAASACLSAITKGDWNAVNSMLDRSIGKVKDISEVHQHNYDDEFDKAPKENIIELLRRSNSK